MFDLITDKRTRQLHHPTVFLTNACGCDTEKAEKMSRWFNIKVKMERVLVSVGGRRPCKGAPCADTTTIQSVRPNLTNVHNQMGF